MAQQQSAEKQRLEEENELRKQTNAKDEERRWEIEKQKYGVRGNIISALIGAVATVIGALIGLLPKAYDIGHQKNEAKHIEQGPIGTVLTGISFVNEIAKPNAPLYAASEGQAPQRLPVPSPAPSPQPPSPATPEEIASKPETIARCSGLGDLKLKSVRVDSLANGYTVTMRVHNDGATQVLYVANAKLTDGTSSQGGNTMPASGPYYIQSTMDPKQLSQLYAQGVSFTANDDSTIRMEFGGRRPEPAPSTVTLSSSFLHFTKDDSDNVKRDVTSMGCEAIPVASQK